MQHNCPRMKTDSFKYMPTFCNVWLWLFEIMIAKVDFFLGGGGFNLPLGFVVVGFFLFNILVFPADSHNPLNL